MRVTLLNAREYLAGTALGVCEDSPRLLKWINEATHRALLRGKYFGSYAKYKLLATSSCITLPPQLASIERAAVCGQPMRVRSQFFEFLENGFGILGGSCTSGDCSTGLCGDNCWPDAVYRGHFCSSDDIRGDDKKLTLVCDAVTDVGKKVLLLGWDQSGNWIRSTIDGVISDGVQVLLAQNPGTTTPGIFSALTDVQLPDDLDGQVWLYEKYITDGSTRLLSNYQYFETRPSYPRYLVPYSCSGGCSNTVEVIAKHEFIPVKKDSDYLVIGCLPALKDLCMAIKKYENSVNQADVAEAAQFEAMAYMKFDDELTHYLGGVQFGITMSGPNIGMADPIATLI